MEVIKAADEIHERIKLLKRTTAELRERTQAKAEAIAEYDKKLAVTIIGLRNGKKFELDGETTENPPATIIEKIAKGICWRERLEMDRAETAYGALLTAIRSITAELNGFQSIYRHLDER